MATVKNKMPLALIGLLLALVCAVQAGEDTRPAIVRMDLYVESGFLTGDITSRGLFSERIVGTVQSGLPAVVELFYHLIETGGSPVQTGMHSYSLEYDVWDDVYSVAGRDTTLLLPSLEAMRSVVEHLTSITLVPVDEMLPQRTYFIQMSVAVSPLQGTDSDEMTGWVMQNVESRGSAWHEHMLDLNDLIEHFFSRGGDSQTRSKWFKSARFNPSQLPLRGREEE